MNQNEMLDFTNAFNKITNAFQQNEKFSLPILAARAEKYALRDPDDTALNMAASILKKMASSKNFISRAELNKLYESLYKRGTNLKKVFAEELDREEQKAPTMMPYECEETAGELDYSTTADPYFANALAGAFENKETLFSKTAATKAQNVCKLALVGLGKIPKNVTTFHGRDGFILCKAAYETSKGDTNILIPVEIQDDKALIPTVLVSSKGFVDLTKEAIEDHVSEMAGRTFKVNSEEIINILKVAKHGMPETLDEVDFAIMKMKQANQSASTGGILLKEMPRGLDPIEMPKVAMAEKDQSFMDSLNDPRGQANFLFGEKTVSSGSSFIQRKMAEFGFKSAQVSVTSVADNSIAYTAVIDSRKALKIPVKVENKIAQPPVMAISNGKIANFTKSGISELLAGECDSGVKLSRSYEMQSHELFAEVQKGIAQGNASLIDDAMTVLAEKDVVVYKKALDLIAMHNSNPNYKVASTHASCSKKMKIASHSEMVCGHLNLPLNKVFQDSKGYCRPLHRQGQPEGGQDDAFLVAAKLLGTL